MLKRFAYIPSSLLAAIIPLFFALLLLFLWGQKTLFDFHLPVSNPYWNDEMMMWIQVNSFRAAGLDAGYHTLNEVPARLEFSHYYTWGLPVPAFYGMIARFTGWEAHTMILINAALIVGAVQVLVAIGRFSYKQILYTGMVLSLFPTLIIYWPTIMLEGLNIALAILLAAVCIPFIQKPEQRVPRWYLGFVLLVLIFATLLRYTWILLFFPIILLDQYPQLSRKRVFWVHVIGAVLAGVLFIGYSLTAAPYPNAATRALSDLSSLPGTLGYNILLNIGWYIFPTTYAVTFRYMLLILLIYLWRVARRSKPGEQEEVIDLYVHLYQLGLIILFVLAVYNVGAWRDLRVWSPHILFTLVLLIARQRWEMMNRILVGMLIVLLSLVLVYQDMFREHYTPLELEQDAAYWRNAFVEAGMAYNPDAENAWCNSITTYYPFWNQQEYLLAFDPGIGYSYFWEIEDNLLELPFKAQYILLDQERYEDMGSPDDFEVLLELPDGTLYKNHQSRCIP